MILTAKVKLKPTDAQSESLKRTLETANAACDYISNVAWDTRVFGKFQIQKLVYNNVKIDFELTAQLVIRCISKVADAYKLDKKTKREFQPFGSIAYDSRILSWKLHPEGSRNKVSIWTVDGRQKMTFLAHDRAKELLSGERGESDLCLINGEFYLLTACEVNEPALEDVADFLGVDLGVANIAVDSDGTIHQGKTVKNVRYRHRELRTKLQKKGTRSAKRRLKKLSGKEKRFSTWTNHNISKDIVVTAKDTATRRQPGIAIEELGAGRPLGA